MAAGRPSSRCLNRLGPSGGSESLPRVLVPGCGAVGAGPDHLSAHRPHDDEPRPCNTYNRRGRVIGFERLNDLSNNERADGSGILAEVQRL